MQSQNQLSFLKAASANFRQNRKLYGKIPGSHYVQEIIMGDDDLQFLVFGYQISQFKLIFYYIGCLLSGGALYLLCRWFPEVLLWCTAVPCPFEKATLVYIKNHLQESSIEPLARQELSGSLSEVFPFTFMEKLKYAKDKDIELAQNELIHFHYRYVRFNFNPTFDQFEPNYYWRDPKWSTREVVMNARNTSDLVCRRREMFGTNTIDIKEKPIVR